MDGHRKKERKTEQQDKEKYCALHNILHDHNLFDCYSHCRVSGNIATQSFIDTLDLSFLFCFFEFNILIYWNTEQISNKHHFLGMLQPVFYDNKEEWTKKM